MMTPTLLPMKSFLTKYMSIKEQLRNNLKKCDALNDLNATLATNYDNLLCKFNLLSKEHEELKLKTESIKNGTNGPFEKVQSLVQSLSLRQMLLLLALI